MLSAPECRCYILEAPDGCRNMKCSLCESAGQMYEALEDTTCCLKVLDSDCIEPRDDGSDCGECATCYEAGVIKKAVTILAAARGETERVR